MNFGNVVFVYLLDWKYQVLDLAESKLRDKQLKASGWKHTATLDHVMWMQCFLNNGCADRLEQIKELAI